MTVVFDAEPLLAFSFDEPGAGEVERWLDRVYDGERDGYISTINLAEFRYVAARETSVEQADAHIDDLRDMGVTRYDVDDLCRVRVPPGGLDSRRPVRAPASAPAPVRGSHSTSARSVGGSPSTRIVPSS